MSSIEILDSCFTKRWCKNHVCTYALSGRSLVDLYYHQVEATRLNNWSTEFVILPHEGSFVKQVGPTKICAAVVKVRLHVIRPGFQGCVYQSKTTLHSSISLDISYPRQTLIQGLACNFWKTAYWRLPKRHPQMQKNECLKRPKRNMFFDPWWRFNCASLEASNLHPNRGWWHHQWAQCGMATSYHFGFWAFAGGKAPFENNGKLVSKMAQLSQIRLIIVLWCHGAMVMLDTSMFGKCYHNSLVSDMGLLVYLQFELTFIGYLNC